MRGSSARPITGDLRVALMLLTRLPVGSAPADRGAASAWAWPLVGGLVGLAGWGVGWLALTAGLPIAAAAGLAVSAQIAITGALHEDGLADCADGLGGLTPERRLAIMRDSRLGTYGALALVLSLGLRWSLMAALLAWPGALITTGALSRGGMALVMAALPPARPDGLSANAGRPGAVVATAASVVALGIAGLAVGPAPAFVAALAGCLAAALVAAWARSRLGGQTGDVLGAAQQAGELAALAALVAL